MSINKEVVNISNSEYQTHNSVVLAIVGSRSYNNYNHFSIHLKHYLETYKLKIDRIVSGGANGIDTLAQKYATEHKIPITIHYADWARWGRSAGPMRNQLIINDATHLVAFPDSKSIGTWDSVNKAKKKHIPIKIYDV